jgi:hypothetical protein
MLTAIVSPGTQLIVEVGSWVGRSTRFLADLAPNAVIVAIDHWEGSPEHHEDPELAKALPHLYEAFLAESWDYRARIIPVKMTSIEGLKRVAEAGLQPQLGYIDADHSYESVLNDILTALDRFPESKIAGDDYDWPGVKQALDQLTKERGIRVELNKTGWLITR